MSVGSAVPAAAPAAGALLAGKTVVVTGGSSGIGAAVARAAASEGARVVVDHHAQPHDAGRVVDEIRRAGGQAIAVEADVSRVADVQTLIDTAVQHFGRLDVLVNNAGVEKRASVLDATEQQVDDVLAVDLKGVFFATQRAARQFVAQGGGGVIVNISSVHEDWAMPGNVAYCMAKGGVRMLVRTAGVELARHGIRVVNVGPGAVDTPMNAPTVADPQKLAALKAAIPLGWMAEPDDIAQTVVFLASDRARYVTATSVFVDGGLMQGSLGL